MSSPPASPPTTSASAIDRDRLLASILSRDAHSTSSSGPSRAQLAQDKLERQEFRRILFVNIGRHNAEKAVAETTKVLHQLSTNIVKNPNEDKYKRFKTTNALIQRALVDAQGGLEYAQAMGFRAEVQDFQPIYIFKPTPQKMNSLRLGIEILEEAMAIAAEKEGRIKAAAVGSKGEVERRKQMALLQFEDDRQDKLIHDQREKRRVNDIAKTAAEAPAPAPAHEGTSETDQGAQRPPTYQQGQRLGTRDNFVNNAMPEVDSERDDN